MIVACLRLRAVCRAVGYSRHFSRTGAASMSVKVGDSLPDVDLYENEPGNKVNAAKQFATGKHVIFGVPGAFTPGCSKTHLPEYVRDFDKLKGKGVTSVSCVAVNDPFVMKAWGEQHNAEGKVTMLADTCGDFTKKLGLDLDLSAVLGSVRCKRFSMVVEDGKIKDLNVEPDGTGLTCSLSTSMLEKL
ncbi:peroxiredoxin-5, mitochondrial-like [Mizuhopecten yessoensis]|uniref:Peroxiredoxin-5 n=1 Tax=Mizuhopecten yessoensis TaxID=6573 RepID=A0A210Q804_MIZYE|nr:peroxiredoxin-5, mitochondrial-like [Mizuhopecten yessoensis]OWF44860.1 Peroxiredoxin-5, mitochondrial [Mizuhopecten yessoensis]